MIEKLRQDSESDFGASSPFNNGMGRSTFSAFASQPLHLSDYYPIPDLYLDLLARLKGEGEGEAE